MAETGKHTPISNLATETLQDEQLLEDPEAGSAEGVVEADSEVEPVPRPEALESMSASGEAASAPDTSALLDIGAASFGVGQPALETVHGVDNRVRITATSQYPYRAIASLLITARDGSQWIGTGWFISPRTLATAGHCVYITNSGIAARDGWVKTIQVMAGRNGSQLPYGSVTSSHFWSVKGWADSGDENYDYGAIILPTPLGTTVGTFGMAVLPDAELKGSIANVTGYPGDKPSGTLWHDSKGIAAVSATKVHYDIDTAGGQSGAAVYVIRDRKRYGVAVHAYGGAVTNSGTRISGPVFRNLKAWKA
jgi:glutamyl endopeptidase